MAKASLLSLPVAPSLPQRLTPDPVVPTPRALFSLSKYSGKDDEPLPSMLRRSRQVNNAHFAFVTPAPLEFPYRITDDIAAELVPPGEEGVDIETLMSRVEPDVGTPVLEGETLAAYSSPIRDKLISKARLLGLSKRCLIDIIPSLDVGDALEAIASPDKAPLSEAAKQLTEVLSGRLVITSKDHQFAPWSLCYGGHQFGSWAGQLGDGRAISILTTPAPSLKHQHGRFNPPVAELQLKGAGRTPFSRFADGLAVLRSSIREYLGSEAMAALNIPTSRALSIAHLPDLQVVREREETGAVVCRVAPSWVRIGNFELLQSRGNWDALLRLTRYAAEHVFGYDLEEKGSEAARLVLKEVAVRNAHMVAGWQAYGFMHGVINTDNVSILGLTIDYGPYAFMDVFGFGHVCNHSDDLGRYSYSQQPDMIKFALKQLGVALGELIGAELEGGEVKQGWADSKSPEERKAWQEKSQAYIEEVLAEFKTTYDQEVARLFGQRLGIKDATLEDQRELFQPLLQLLNDLDLDFFQTFRLLCRFPGMEAESLDAYLDQLAPLDRVPKYLADEAKPRWREWLARWSARLPQTGAEALYSSMRPFNPRFVLRQWVLEEAIKRAEESQDAAFLTQLLEMASNPFEEYGEVTAGDSAACPTKAAEEAARLCSQGPDQMLGFQCSCSS